MDAPRVCFTEWSKSEREQNIAYYAFIWNLKNSTDESICRVGIETYVEKKMWTQQGMKREGQTESGYDIYALPCV